MESAVLPVLVEEEGSQKQSWVLVELQGELKPKEGAENDWKGKKLGRLIDRDSDNPILIIGSSKLEGKRMKLTRPLAILKRADDGFVYKGVVDEKVVFKTRPKPLTT